MKKTTIPIRGMHCKSCEILIREKLEELKEVEKVEVKIKERKAYICSTTPLDMERIRQAVEEAGYEVGEEKPRHWLSRNPSEYMDLGLTLLVLMVLYHIASMFGIVNFSMGGGDPSNLFVVLLIGITAGFSTCMALVGGLVLGISSRHAEMHPEATPVQKFRPHLYFHLGRILSYFIFGGLIGVLGKVFKLSSPMLGMLTIVVGVVMFFLGLKLTEISPRLSSWSFTLPSGISRALGIKKHHNKEYSHRNSILLGGLTFFLPCGFTQAMQLYAMSTGSFVTGALIMSLFAIGTAPGLLGIGGLTSIVKGAFARKFFKFAGVVVVMLALFNIQNGYHLTGWSFGESAVPTSTQIEMEDGVQIIRMNQDAWGFSPKKFVVKKGIPVKWIVTAEDLNTCASGISAPKVGVTKNLRLGENNIQFTPKETGVIKFTCLMGMYPGTITVID